MSTKSRIEVPSLECDKAMNRKVGRRGMLERAIVAELARQIVSYGGSLVSVEDLDNSKETVVRNVSDVLEAVFSSDEPVLHFQIRGGKHGVVLAPGNGASIIHEWRIDASFPSPAFKFVSSFLKLPDPADYSM